MGWHESFRTYSFLFRDVELIAVTYHSVFLSFGVCTLFELMNYVLDYELPKLMGVHNMELGV